MTASPWAALLTAPPGKTFVTRRQWHWDTLPPGKRLYLEARRVKGARNALAQWLRRNGIAGTAYSSVTTKRPHSWWERAPKGTP
jgi:hypothetical protein